MDLQLEKRIITSTIATLSLYSEYARIENFEADFKRIKKKAKKEKYTNIKIELRCTCQEHDKDTVSKTTFAIIGDRLETDEEVIKRLKYSQSQNKRHIEDIIRNHNIIERYEYIDKKYQEAIDFLTKNYEN